MDSRFTYLKPTRLKIQYYEKVKMCSCFCKSEFDNAIAERRFFANRPIYGEQSMLGNRGKTSSFRHHAAINLVSRFGRLAALT